MKSVLQGLRYTYDLSVLWDRRRAFIEHMSLKCGSGVCGCRFVDGRVRQRVRDFELEKTPHHGQ